MQGPTVSARKSGHSYIIFHGQHIAAGLGCEAWRYIADSNPGICHSANANSECLQAELEDASIFGMLSSER